MKLNKNLLYAAVITAGSLALLSSCSDKDNPVEPVNYDITVYDDNIDPGVRPGDNFFMYSIGSWWQRTALPEDEDSYSYLFDEVGEIFQKRTDGISPAESGMDILLQHSFDLYTNAEADLQKLNEALARVEAATTKEELWTLMGALATEGFQMPFRIMSLAHDGLMRLVFAPSFELEVTSAFDSNNSWGDDDWNDYNWNYGSDDDLMSAMARNPRIAIPIEPVTARATTRGFAPEKWPMLVKVSEGLGVAPEKAFVITEEWYDFATQDMDIESAEPLEKLQALDKDELAGTIRNYILDNKPLCSTEAMADIEAEGSTFSGDKFISNLGTNYMGYFIGYIFAKKYCSPQMKARGEADVAELKEAFRERLTANTWLSEESKAIALDKLDAMVVNVAYPEWMDEGIIDLSQTKSMFEDAQTIRRKYNTLIKKLVDMPYQQGAFQALCASVVTLVTFNSYYAPNFNAMNILPAFLMEPLYGDNADVATRYAVMSVFAHEMTHGFDNTGSQWDKKGDNISLWASAADGAEFQRRAQLLVDYYNTFEVVPGIFADGKKTLNENIADLGGLEIAFQAMTNKLKKDGLSGEELRQQQRNFFVAYANLWRLKFNDSYAEMLVGSDVHSCCRERVNGVVANMDAWYDLFDVKPGNKLYRSPEDRIHIW